MKLIGWGLVAGMVTYLSLFPSSDFRSDSCQEPSAKHSLELQATEVAVVEMKSRYCREPLLDEGEPCLFEAGVLRPIVLEDLEKSFNNASANVKQMQKALVDLRDFVQTELQRKKI